MNLTYFATMSLSIAFTEFINWRRLNIEQSYGLRLGYGIHLGS